MFSSHRVAPTTSAIVIVRVPAQPTRVLLRNKGSQSVFIGAWDVTANTGFELAADEPLWVELGTNDDVWGVVAVGTGRVDVLTIDLP